MPQETADTETESDASDSAAGERKPSYVGLSHSVNGYTAYSHYNPRAKKISPPLQIPVSPPRTLDRYIENIGRKYIFVKSLTCVNSNCSSFESSEVDYTITSMRVSLKTTSLKPRNI